MLSLNKPEYVIQKVEGNEKMVYKALNSDNK